MHLVNLCLFGVLDQIIFFNSCSKLKHRIYRQIANLSLKVVSQKSFSVQNGFNAGMDVPPRGEVFFCTLHILPRGVKIGIIFFLLVGGMGG